MRLPILAALCLLAAAPAGAADLVVTVTGVAAPAGDVRVIVIADPDGAARQDLSRNVAAAGAAGGVLTTRFQGVAPGRYGVIASHDSSVNHALEKAVTGKVGAARATSPEVLVTVAEPAAAVTLALH